MTATVDTLVGAVAGSAVLGIIALIFSAVLAVLVVRKPRGNEKMIKISTAIARGAKAFLVAEYKILAPFVIATAVTVSLAVGTWETGLCLVCGASLSALAGWIGMQMAVAANVRTTNAAQTSLNSALRVAFNSGTVMGMSVVGFGLSGLSIIFLAFHSSGYEPEEIFRFQAGFAMGASSIALFARVGGGIFTKAADVGSDLVGKVEAGIPEDDPRNPGVIADNVGDNVGDVAGMGADLFESYVGSIVAGCTLGWALGVDHTGVLTEEVAVKGAIVPFIVSSCGLASCFVAVFCVRTKEEVSQENLLNSMRFGVAVATVLTMTLVAISHWGILGIDSGITICIYLGMLSGVGIGYSTEYATSFSYKPTQTIAEAGVTGPATVIIQGIGVGQLSTLPPVIIICITVMGCFSLGDIYGVSISACGMLSTLGVTLATDAYGPVADNAGGIAEMAELPAYVRERTDQLDALGNTTAATGKGFAIGSAVLTAFGLLSAFVAAVPINCPINLTDGVVSSGLLLGVMLPFVFSAFTMLAVGKSAGAMVIEVRRQFREIPGLMEGTAEPEYERCVKICTTAALKEMVIPGLLAVVIPFIVGFGFGPRAVAGVLFGAITSGFLLAVMMANAGGAWDNAKKWVESGMLGGKGTPLHAAVVVGDTVGDPFKDTSGPSLNILIKLMSIVALVLAPAFAGQKTQICDVKGVLEEGSKRGLPPLWPVGLIILLVFLAFSCFWNFRNSSKSLIQSTDYMKVSPASAPEPSDDHQDDVGDTVVLLQNETV